jgi:hypothetical protein
MEGHVVGVGEWCALVDEILAGDERSALDALVFTGARGPGARTCAPGFDLTEVPAPVLDVGFDPSTFVTRRVRGLVPGGLADRAGLREDDAVELPGYPEAQALGPDDVLEIRVERDGETSLHSIRLTGLAVPVPQWRRRND